MGVTSVIETTCNPADCKARIAASRPEPGPRTYTSTWRTPCSIALRAALSAVTCAAYGVLLREPLKFEAPALLQASTLPLGSAMVTSVLLNVAWICARPRGTDLRSRRRCRPTGRLGAFSAMLTGSSCSELLFSLLAESRRAYFFAAFFLPATVFFAPRLVRALVRVRCPCTG